MRAAARPTSGSPILGKCTTLGVSRPPSVSARSTGKPASITPIKEFVVPRSMPAIGDISDCGLNSAAREIELEARLAKLADPLVHVRKLGVQGCEFLQMIAPSGVEVPQTG